MQVDMPVTEDTNEEWQREVDAILARSRELLSTSKEHRERVDRTVAQATSNLRRTLLQLRRD
jgi:hypothetical protein